MRVMLLARYMRLGSSNCASQELGHGAIVVLAIPSAGREPLPCTFQSTLSNLDTESAPPIVLCSFESG